MCGPALTLVGLGLQAYSSYVSSRQQQANLNAQAAYDERSARQERQRTQYEAENQRREAKRIFGRQRVSYLSGGVALSGTPSLVIEESAREAELDAQAILYGGEVNARNFEDRARINRTNASTVGRSAFLGAAAPLIGGIGKFALQNSYGG